MDSGLRDKVVVITGGAGGMGRAAAERFLEEGSVVVVADVSEPDAREAPGGEAAGSEARPHSPPEELEGQRSAVELEIAPAAVGGRAALTVESPSAQHLLLDVTDVQAVERLMETVAETYGRLDVLVNAAGLWVEGPAETMTEHDWDRVVDVNLKGLFFCCARAIPHLKATRGCIVNLSSDCGLVGTPDTSVYTASKGGVVLLTKALALELAPHLVRVNAVCPADVMTPMLEGQARDFGGGDEEGYLRTLLTCYAQGDKARFIEPEEVAELIVFLCSKAAAPITGAAVPIDFGTTAGYGYG